MLRRAATSAHPLLRRAAAQSPHLPPDLLRLLAHVEDPVVENLLGIHHPDTPEEVLMRVFARLGGTFSAWMAETHPRFPREGLAARYADNPDGNYRRLAVRDPAATPAQIERLSHDPEVWTRQAAAGDPRLPLQRLREALHVPELASSAGANPALPEDEMATVLDRAGVPGNPAIPSDIGPCHARHLSATVPPVLETLTSADADRVEGAYVTSPTEATCRTQATRPSCPWYPLATASPSCCTQFVAAFLACLTFLNSRD
ncbi:hypothetical protein [Streptomyces sp. NPDC002788]